MLAPMIKVAGSLVLLFTAVVESQVSVGVSDRPSSTLSTIVTIGVQDIALATTLAGTRAYFRSTSVLNS